MTIPPVTPEAARLTITGLMNQIHELMDQTDPRAWEEAAAKALEVARTSARVAHTLEREAECPVIQRISGSEIDSLNPLIKRSAS